MCSFNSVIYPLISSNRDLFEFKNSFAIDGCWILDFQEGNEVLIDKKLSIILGANTTKIPLCNVLNGTLASQIIEMLSNDTDKLSTFSQTIKIFHISGTSVIQQVKFFLLNDQKGQKYLIGGHQLVTSEHELIEAKDKFGNIIEGSDLATWEWNVQTGETYINEKWAEIIGYKVSELAPISFKTWEKYTHEEDLEGSNKALQDHLEGRKFIYEYDSRMRHKDGHWVWVKDKGKVFTWTADGKPEWMVGSHQDITEKKHQELELLKFRDLLEGTTRMATIGVWEVLLKDKQMYFGNVTKSIHDLPDDYVPTLEEAINFYPEGTNRENILHHFEQAVKKGISYDVELQIETFTNKLKWVRVIGIPEFKEGKCFRVSGLFQDIDKIKIAERKSIELMEATQEQNNRLMNFAYIVSHNLRSHANNFGMLVGMLGQDLPEANRKKIVNMLSSASKKLKDTTVHLDEIVDINLSLSDNFANLPLNKFVQSSVDGLAMVAAAKNIKIIVDLEKEFVVYGVPAYIESLTLNFLSNAIKYADRRKAENFLKISAQQLEDEVQIIFEDNGLGIDLEKYGSKLFGMYKTFHTNTDARGIGLFITRNQVEAMGGRISVTSKVGEGSTFTVHLKAKTN